MSKTVYPYKNININVNGEDEDAFVGCCSLKQLIDKLKLMEISENEYENVKISANDEYCFNITYTKQKTQQEIDEEILEKENIKIKRQEEKEKRKQEKEKAKQEKQKVWDSLNEEQKRILGLKIK